MDPWILLSMLSPATIAVPVGELHCTAQAGSRDCIVPAQVLKAIGFVFAAGVMLMFRRVGGVVKRDRMQRYRSNM